MIVFPELIEMKRLLVFASALALAAPLAASSVAGKVNFNMKKGQSPVVTETLVWLEPAAGRVAPKPPGKFQMTTRGKTLIPHVLVIPVGSTVEFPNDDPISHNLFSLSSASTFDLGLYRRGAGKSQKFTMPGIVNVYCNVHPAMSAVIHVMPTPYYVFADAAGNYAIHDVPAGKYKLVAWNEQGGQTAAMVNVGPAGVANVAVTLDSSNYRAASHLNKVGKPYTAVPRDY
jgi:plastocyanin